MSRIVLDGRTDIDDFFKLSGILNFGKLMHTPFLAFITTEDTTTVHIIDDARELLTLPDDTPVMCQWRGEWSSDFFQFTVRDVREQLEKRDEPLKRAKNVVKRLGPKGGFRSLSYEYMDERGVRIHDITATKAEAQRLEAFFRKHNIPVELEIG